MGRAVRAGRDLRRVRTNATFAQRESSIAIANFATYHDLLAKRGGCWRIAHRAIVSPAEKPPANVGPVPGA
jgi:hypothetical protein